MSKNKKNQNNKDPNTEYLQEENGLNKQQVEESTTNTNTQNSDIDYKDKYLRLLAEYTNFIKQKELEVNLAIQLANKNILLRIINIIDDVEIGLKQNSISEDVKEVLEMIKSKLLSILEYEGVAQLDIKPGQDYNSQYCEVIHTIENPELEGKIIDVVRTGYLWHGKVLRMSGVIVGKA